MKQDESFEVIKFKYDYNIYSLDYLCILVENNKITKEQFHFITTYSYDGIKKEKGEV